MSKGAFIASNFAAAQPVKSKGGRQYIAAVRSCWPILLPFSAAAAAQALFAQSSDVSWLITFCERVLAGDRPYIDVIESNPPAAFLVYMPAVLAARASGFSPELLVALFVFVAIIASLSFCALVFARAGLATRFGTRGLAFVAAVVVLMPGRAFAEREHVALIAGLPLLAILAARASGAQLPISLSIWAGLGAAVMASIKPHFALIIVAALPYLARRSGWKVLLQSAELYSFAGFAALSLCFSVVFFPAYLEKIVPLTASIYAPVRTPLLGLLLNHGFLCWAALALCLLLLGGERVREGSIAVPALGSVGAMGAFLIQGKGWPYHIYPATALLMLGFGALALEEAGVSRRARTIIALTAAAAALLFNFAFFSQPSRQDVAPLGRVVAALAPHPKVLVVGPDIALGFPLTRNVSGLWVGTPMALWITASIDFLTRKTTPDEATLRKYDAYLRFDRETLVADIQNKHPDAILVENEKWRAWAFAHEDVAAALADYAPVGEVGEVAVYGRKLKLRPTQ